MKPNKFLKTALCLLVSGSLLTGLTACGTTEPAAKAPKNDLTRTVTVTPAPGKTADEVFLAAQTDFAVKLFRESLDEKKNSLISPLSVMLALSMTANGAGTATREEMEDVLGGGIPLEELNEYLRAYTDSLTSEKKLKLKLQIANSIWFRDDADRLQVEPDFLDTNARYYNASIFKSAFDDRTLNDINNWVKENTDGMIDRILDEIDPDTVMYLINALTFDADWETPFEKNDTHDRQFTTDDGTERTVPMMYSDEHAYLADGKATGFIKDYKNGRYRFAALLPNEPGALDDYIAGLTGESLMQTLNSVQEESVSVGLPKFSYDYSIVMNDILASLGMPTAFDSGNADFSKLGKSSLGNIYIGEVLHKTHIDVDELGTKAAAVTKVEMKDEAAALVENEVILNRPFVYFILDGETNLPLFMGTVVDIEG